MLEKYESPNRAQKSQLLGIFCSLKLPSGQGDVNLEQMISFSTFGYIS